MQSANCHKKATIWYISKYFTPKNIGSAGNRGWYLLKEFKNNGCHSIAITSNSNHLANTPKLLKKVTKETHDGVEIIWLKTISYTKSKSIKRIISWLHFEWNLFWLKKSKFPKPDYVIVSSLSLLTIINGLVLKYFFGCKLIFEVRDIWPLTLTENNFSHLNPLVYMLSIIEKIAYRFSDLIVGTMPNLTEHVSNVSSTKIKTICIPMGYDEVDLRNSINADKRYLDKYLDPNYFNVVYAGSIGISNSLESFFETAIRMKSEKKMRFILIGEGPLRLDYQKKYQHYKNIIFAPKISKNEVVNTLKYADLLYLSFKDSKIWQFGQSVNKLIDYMLSGRPIVCSFNGFPTMINEANCGLIVDAEDCQQIEDAIEKLYLLTRGDRSKIGMRGRKWILNNRNYKTLAENYLQALNSL